MKKILMCIMLTSALTTVGQINHSQKAFSAQEYNKDQSTYYAKEFLIIDVLKVQSNEVIHFEADALASAISGELTSLVYFCEDKNMEGLIFGFWGDYWNDAGVVYKGYQYKNISKENALLLFEKINKAIDDNEKYLKKSNGDNNIYFKFEDMTFLISSSEVAYNIRVFWNGFDSEWNKSAFKRTERRFMRKINKK